MKRSEWKFLRIYEKIVDAGLMLSGERENGRMGEWEKGGGKNRD